MHTHCTNSSSPLFVVWIWWLLLYNVHRPNFEYCATLFGCILPAVRDGEGERITCGRRSHYIMPQGSTTRQRKRPANVNKSSSSSSRASSSTPRAGSRGWLLAVGVLVAIAAAALGVLVVLIRRHVATPLGVPPVISPNMVNTSEYQMRLWGTYR